jgi:hypothetical protein
MHALSAPDGGRYRRLLEDGKGHPRTSGSYSLVLKQKSDDQPQFHRPKPGLLQNSFCQRAGLVTRFARLPLGLIRAMIPVGEPMAKREVCGNGYDRSFGIRMVSKHA